MKRKTNRVSVNKVIKREWTPQFNSTVTSTNRASGDVTPQAFLGANKFANHSGASVFARTGRPQHQDENYFQITRFLAFVGTIGRGSLFCPASVLMRVMMSVQESTHSSWIIVVFLNVVNKHLKESAILRLAQLYFEEERVQAQNNASRYSSKIIENTRIKQCVKFQNLIIKVRNKDQIFEKMISVSRMCSENVAPQTIMKCSQEPPKNSALKILEILVQQLQKVAQFSPTGAFLIPYIILLTVIGRPMYYMELCLGQFSSYGTLKAFGGMPLASGKQLSTPEYTTSPPVLRLVTQQFLAQEQFNNDGEININITFTEASKKGFDVCVRAADALALCVWVP